MLKAVIIEDEATAADLLVEMLKHADADVEVVDKCYDLPFGVKSIRRNHPDIVFLDIELPVHSGIQLLDFFNPEEITFQIIFTTAYNQYATNAFEMCAIDYLLKPIDQNRLNAALQKAENRVLLIAPEVLETLKHNLTEKTNQKIVVPVVKGFEILNLSEIYYFHAEGSYTMIRAENRPDILVSKNLKHFQSLLAGMKNFVRVHRSYIVNLNFAKKLLRDDGVLILLKNDSKLPVAEEKLAIVLETLQNL